MSYPPNSMPREAGADRYVNLYANGSLGMIGSRQGRINAIAARKAKGLGHFPQAVAIIKVTYK